VQLLQEVKTEEAVQFFTLLQGKIDVQDALNKKHWPAAAISMLPQQKKPGASASIYAGFSYFKSKMPQQPGGRMQAPYWAQGLPPGGHMESEQFCGIFTWLVGCCLFPLVCCCPCDSRQVYVSPDGRRVPEPRSC
jgi:hypothetical protein